MSSSPIITFFFFFIFFLSISLVLLPTTHAFNITRILKRYPQFDTYNENLGLTGLAKYINTQKSVTVLVIANDQLRSFAQLARYDVKKILTFHLVFGYYDAARLKSFASRTTLPTFYQGTAALTSNYEGNGVVAFRSSGENPDFKGVQLLDTIEAQQDIISVLQIASIVPMTSPSPPPTPQQPPSASPNASPPRKLLAPATAPAPSTQEKNSPAPASPTSTKTKPGKNAPGPSPSTKTTPSKNAQSPPPTPSTNKTKPSNSAPSPSNATKPSITAPSEAPTESNSTTPPAPSPPTEALVPDSSTEEDNAPTPVVSPPKPSSETPAPAPDTDVPAPAPAPEKSSARERISSGNYLASIVVIFTAACFFV